MRNLIILVGLGSAAACAGETAKVDTTVTAGDSTVVAGPPTVPSSASAETAKTPTPSPSTPAPSGAKTTPPPATASRADSVRGIVSVVGTSFEKRVMIAERGTQRRVEVVGSLSSLVGHVAGADVAVSGMISGNQLNASRFVVKSVDNAPAIDGTLRTEGGALYIVTADGARTRIATPPPPLVGRDGARVWITGDPAKAVSSFGFIDPPR